MKQEDSAIFVFVAIVWFIITGPAGLIITAYDAFKRGQYNSQQPPKDVTVLKHLLKVVIILLVVGALLSPLMLNLPPTELGSLQPWSRFIVQSTLGIILTQRLLHSHNIYCTNLNMLKSVKLSPTLKRLFNMPHVAIFFKRTIKPSPSAPITSAALGRSPSSLGAKSQPAILIDRSGDPWRVKFILLSLVGLALLLLYFYLNDHPEFINHWIHMVDPDAVGWQPEP